jgi:transposase
MFGLPSGTKIYLYAAPVDGRKSFDGLCALVESAFHMQVLDGHLFLFVNRRGDRLKALWWEAGGLILWHKRLERGTFELPSTQDNAAQDNAAHVTLDAVQLAMLIGGVSLSAARVRRQRLNVA